MGVFFMRMLHVSLVAGSLGAAAAFSPVAATPLTAPFGLATAAQSADVEIIQVQTAPVNPKKVPPGAGAGPGPGGKGRPNAGGPPPRHAGGHNHGNHGSNRGRNVGAGIAAGAVLGIIGTAIAVDQARKREAIQGCIDAYPNYDPETQTWWDGRGRPRRCP